MARGSVDGRSKTIRPAMKFSVLMPVVVASSALTSTCAPLLKTMPLGLISTTCPLAVSRPAITDGSGALTRLSAMAFADG